MRLSRQLFLLSLVLPAPGFAQVPPTMIASLGKQILQNLVFGSVKNELIGSLAGMGCKGAALAGLAAAANAGGAAGAARSLTAGARGPLPSGAAMRSAGPGGMPPGMGGMGAMDPATMQKAMETMQQQSGGGVSPEQMAMMQNAMVQMQGAMSQPLSREDTKAVFDEMAELGLLSDAMRSEAKDCVNYAAPGAGDSIGAAGAMLKNTVLPAARQAKERMAALTPEEQEPLVDGMVEALNSASPADRKAFFDGLGLGFFPPQVVEQVRARGAK
jgi:hypothetical protein